MLNIINICLIYLHLLTKVVPSFLVMLAWTLFLSGYSFPWERWKQVKEEYIRMAENSMPYQSQTFGSILGPELENYFNGSKSLDETIRVITNRVPLYLNENK